MPPAKSPSRPRPAGLFTRLVMLLAAVLAPAVAPAADDFIPPEQAFRYQVSATAEAIVVEWNVTPGYYLYRKRMGFSTATPGITLGEPVWPAGLPHEDEYFGKQEIYRGAGNRFSVPYTRAAGAPDTVQLDLKLQGCADAGLCYPPSTWTTTVTLPAAAGSGGVAGLAALAQSGKGAAADDGFIPPDQAFRVEALPAAADRLRLRFDIKPGYYLYLKRMKVEVQAAGVQTGSPRWPAGEEHEDEYFGKQTIFRGLLEVDVPLIRDAAATRAGAALTVQVGLQGCADAGLCYPPETRTLQVALPSLDAPASAYAAAAVAGGGGNSAGGGMVSEQDSLAQAILTRPLLVVAGMFFIAGLLLSFTPCVLPMVPILSGIIAGQGSDLTPMRGFLLSLSYVLGMALTYAIAGVAFAAAGQQAQAVFQQPWILALFAFLFVALAMAMFGFYELQMPSAIQSRIADLSGRLAGGRFVSTAIMGALSSLVVTACVAPALVGALAFISQTGDMVRGGAALFSFAIGMGTPLLVVGASAGKLLPRAGAWMDTVKAVFGVMFLGVAVWMLERIVPPAVTLVLWAIVAAVGIWVLWPRGALSFQGKWRKLGYGSSALLGVWAALLLTGAALGGKDPFRPLEGTGLVKDGTAALTFTPIRTVADLDRELAAAAAAGQRVMVDFSAEWCVSCKEMEKYTFRDPAVQAALASYRRLQADVTANSADDQALLRRFAIFGPPTTAFFGTDGREHTDFRLVGFVAAEDFRQHLTRLEGTP